MYPTSKVLYIRSKITHSYVKLCWFNKTKQSVENVNNSKLAEFFFRKWIQSVLGPAGTKLISFGGRFWHNECFNCSCSSCGNTNLVGKGFVMDQQDILCPDCGKLPFQKRKTNTNNNNENNVDNKNSNLGRKKADNGNANTGNGLQEISSVNKTP